MLELYFKKSRKLHFINMEEDLIPHNPAKNYSISIVDDERQKVKEFVYKHFKDVTDGPLYGNADDSTIKEIGSPTRKENNSFIKSPCKIQQGAVFSGNILSFECSVCKDKTTYSPNDLLKHFQGAHRETLPTYPCDLCNFVTNEFPALQRHRIEHRNTLVTCELCNDGVQYSLLLLTRHYIMYHSLNGQFTCDWCEFITYDAGTFVQHIHHHNESPWKCSKCKHISFNEEDFQKHMNGHSGTFPFCCQICGYGTTASEYLEKHLSAVHKETQKRSARKATEDGSTSENSSGSLNVMLKTSVESQEAQKISKLNFQFGDFPNQNGKVIKPEISLNEICYAIDGSVAKPDKMLNKVCNIERTLPVMLQECDGSATSDAGGNTNPNGLTVLMVKNKISLPPNCTTKVMGFKTVDGKKHLVLKVIPSSKHDSPIQNHSSPEGVGPFAQLSPLLDKRKGTTEHEECSNSRNLMPPSFCTSPRTESCMQIDQEDIVAVKVKIEEEETSVCSLDSSSHIDDGKETTPLVCVSSNCVDTLCPTVENDHVCNQIYPNQSSWLDGGKLDCNLDSSPEYHSDAASHSGLKMSDMSTLSADEATGLSSVSKVAQEMVLSKHLIENCKLVAEKVGDKLHKIQTNSTDNTKKSYQISQSASEKSNPYIIPGIQHNNEQSFKKVPSGSNPLLKSFPTRNCKELAVGTKNSQSQEVFSFHNYFKEQFSPSATPPLNSENMCGNLTNNETRFESQLKFVGFLQPNSEINGKLKEVAGNTSPQEFKKMSDLEVDAYIPSTEDEDLESVFDDFNIIKIEEENIPITPKQPETIGSPSSIGSFVEKHSDEIITQQLHKEKDINPSKGKDALKQTKTTLQILQLPEGQQPLLLRTSESRLSTQVKPTPGFRLITNSVNPQINVSYMKPGLEKAGSAASLNLATNSRQMGPSSSKAVASERGTALLSTVKPGIGAASNHYVINHSGVKGPLLLSNTQHNSPTDKTAKTQPTCYLIQRSVPLVQNSSTPGLRVASSNLPANSMPVLAMPVSSTDKTSNPQTGRQAFLLRYVTPTKSGLLLNNQDGSTGTQCNQNNESAGNKVIFKIVSPTGGLTSLTSGTPTSSSQPLFLATRPQTQCFLVSSNKTNANSTNGLKKLITIQNSSQKDVKKSLFPSSPTNVSMQSNEPEKPILAPRPIRPPSQRKRRRKQLFDELPTAMYKARRLSHKAVPEKEAVVYWKPVAKDVERTLRLAPFSPLQLVRCPRRYQPVVVLNHPDADIPEVANIMKVVNRYKGAVTKVSLSQKTLEALSEIGAHGNISSTKGASPQSHCPTARAVRSSVQERFRLKLKLRKKSRKKFEVVKHLSARKRDPVVFECWFCGRLFNSQEDWIGHGQRHLMEATRDWNELF
ncbi:zinc finger protein 518A [Nelusetta ayraudi]|uniref:zinc finger protein 518A n=1 Tax=Nelusetta ayraudi TaxID=303726 RepID=UPI003F71E508